MKTYRPNESDAINAANVIAAHEARTIHFSDEYFDACLTVIDAWEQGTQVSQQTIYRCHGAIARLRRA